MTIDFLSPDLERQFRRVSRRLSLCADARDDLHQDLILVALQGGDPARYLLNFSIRHRRSVRAMALRPTISISEMTIDEEPRINDVHSWELDATERLIFAAEIQEQIAKLPKLYRTICRQLMLHSPNRVARMLHRHPSKLRRILDALKKKFNDFETFL